LHNEELHNSHSFPNIVTIIKTRKMVWAGHITCLGEMRNAYKILVQKPEGRYHLEDLGIDAEVNIRMDLKRSGV
jgi:hypothetical protein